MYNLQRVIKTQDTKNIPVQNKYNSPDGWEMEYLTFPGLTKTGCVRHLFTTRTGGTSSGIFESLNLSFTRGDDRDCVLQNYDRVAEVPWRYKRPDRLLRPDTYDEYQDRYEGRCRKGNRQTA